MELQHAIGQILQNKDLSAEQMTAVMQTIMTGGATPAQIGGLLVGLRMKGESIDEIVAAAQVMRSLASAVKVEVPNLVDTCGTGGDGTNTFNISTASALVAAAAGAHVAKHGNRSVSSSSGSADLLEAAGARLDLSAQQVAECIQQAGIGFMFAPHHHGAMKHAIGPRKEMAVRTIFNVLGPLTNPASAPNQVLGVFSQELVEPLAIVLQRLGSEHVLVVHSEEGMDEISIGAPTYISELKDGVINSYTITPEGFDITRSDISTLAVRTAADSLAVINRVFDNNAGPARDVVVLNAGAAIYASGISDSFAAGVERADQVISSGAAREKLTQFVAVTQSA